MPDDPKCPNCGSRLIPCACGRTTYCMKCLRCTFNRTAEELADLVRHSKMTTAERNKEMLRRKGRRWGD